MHKTKYLLSFLLVLILCNPGVSRAEIGYKGICYGSWHRGEYSSPQSDISLDNLKKTHANYVAVVVTGYMDGPNASVVYEDEEKTPSDADVREVIRDVHNRGMGVMLKLHLNVKYPDGSTTWAGEITPGDTEAWFASYRNFMNHYATIAQDNQVELFCIGTELTSMTTGGGVYTAHWKNLISDVRKVFSGDLTFCANYWWEYNHIGFWDVLNIAGISGYCDLIAESNPDPIIPEIEQGWNNSWNGHAWITEFEQWQAVVGKGVIFTEIGYCSVDKAAFKPWDGPRSNPYNGELQAKCYESAFQVFKDKPWFKGMFWWVWLTDPDAGKKSSPYYRDYTPQNKPAESILKRWYAEKGDVNDDGEDNIADVILTLRTAIGLPVTVYGTTCNPPYPAWLTYQADMNSDGIVNISDVIYQLRRAVRYNNWRVTRKGDTVQISYGSTIDYSQYAALDLRSGYFRMVYGPESGWGTSVVLTPSFWRGGVYYQGAPVESTWMIEGNNLALSFTGDISTLGFNGTCIMTPPASNAFSANVNVNVTGNVKLDTNRPGEAFKPVMLSSMHISANQWDTQSAYVGSLPFGIPTEGWIIQPPLKGNAFGLKGGTSVWKTNAPTMEVSLKNALPVTGWVTQKSDPNDDNVGFWAASDTVLPSWQYTITAEP